jgi:hypothetical protein
MEFLFLRAASKKSRAAEASPNYEKCILALARDVDSGTFRMNIQDGGLIIRRNDNADMGE